MQSTFRAISLSYISAPIAVREQLAFNNVEIKELLVKIKDVFGISECLIIATCNRTEVYYSAPTDLGRAIAKLLFAQKGSQNTAEYLQYFDNYNQSGQADRHLFEVSIGLKSKVVGDLQILSQIKQAYQASADQEMAGPYLHRLMHTIFYANKRIVQETTFRDGIASTAYAAFSLANELSSTLIKPKILIIGLGEIGVDVCKYFTGKYFDVTVTNRSIEKANFIAKNNGFKTANFSNLASEIEKADLIISSVRMENPLINSSLLSKIEILGYKYFIDLSVPRSIEPTIEAFAGVVVYNIDTLNERTSKDLQKRLDAIPMVSLIIDEAMDGFKEWTNEMAFSPTVQKLKSSLERIRLEEMARYAKQMNQTDAELIEKITQSMIQKILKAPILGLKSACKRGEANQIESVLSQLFDLESEKLTIKA